MAITYFGGTATSAGEDSGNAALLLCNDPALDDGTLFVCPGSGTFNVMELSHYCKGTAGNIRLALYNSDASTKICEGTAEVAVGTSYGWVGHTSQSSMTPNPATVTGGVEYVIAVTVDNAAIYNGVSISSASGRYVTTDYTGGLPATLTLSSMNTGWVFSLRCGIEAATGGTVIPILDTQYRRRN